MKRALLTIIGFLITGGIIISSLSPVHASSFETSRRACEMALQKRVAAPVILDDGGIALPNVSPPASKVLMPVSMAPITKTALALPQKSSLPLQTTRTPTTVKQLPQQDIKQSALYQKDQIVDALREALAFSPNSSLSKIREKAIAEYKIDPSIFDEAARLFDLSTARDPSSGYTDAQVFKAIREALSQDPDATLEQIRSKAQATFGVTPAQFDRAAKSLNRTTEATQNILSLGDSWIGGKNRTIFSTSLSDSTGLQVTNRAIRGQKLSDILSRLESDIQSSGGLNSIGVVVIHAGGEDFLSQIKDKMTGTGASDSYLKTIQNFDKLIAFFADKGVPIVISPTPILSSSMVIPDKLDPSRYTFKPGVKFVPDPMYKAIADRYPNVTLATGYTVPTILSEGVNLNGGLFPNDLATNRLAVSLAQSVRVAVSY